MSVETEKYSLLQKHLYDCLEYFLYGSIKEHGFHHFVRSRLLRSEPVRQWHAILERSGLGTNNIEPIPSYLSSKKYAHHLAEIYRRWSTIFPYVDSPRQSLPEGQTYPNWFSKGGDSKRYWPVHELKKWMEKIGHRFFIRSIIHGSIGTLDDTSGFSDMDLAFIIRKEVLTCNDRLHRLRKLAIEILSLTHCFDPFMHHGPYYLSEFDLVFYPQNLLPSVVFEYGLTLYSNNHPVDIIPVTADHFGEGLLNDFYDLFCQWGEKSRLIENSWDIEAVLGIVMILPALYLQRKTGHFRYKKETFKLWRTDFTPQQTEIVDFATSLRHTLPERIKPPQSLLKKAITWQWPGMIQRWAIRHPGDKKRVAIANRQIPPDYASRVTSLIDLIRQKIELRQHCSGISDQSPLDAYRHCFEQIIKGPYTDIPFKAKQEDYIEVTAHLIKYWSGQPQKPVSIYQLGSVDVPGHSDLDFVIVWPDRTPIPHHQFEPDHFPQWVRRFLIHPPYFCTESLWNELHAWYPVFDIAHLWGLKLKKPVLNN